MAPYFCLIAGSGGGAKGDMDYKKLLSKRARQCFPTTLNHHTGELLQVSFNPAFSMPVSDPFQYQIYDLGITMCTFFKNSLKGS